jgi:hypothetical protein
VLCSEVVLLTANSCLSNCYGLDGESVRKFLAGILRVVGPQRYIDISVVTMIVTESDQYHQRPYHLISPDHIQMPESTTPAIMMDNAVSSAHREPELKIGT